VRGSARATAARLPLGPGVYRFRDADGRALYLGRAVSLRRRVASYWSSRSDRPHLSAMVGAIAHVEAVECASEHEAAWLERSLLEHELLPWNRTAGGQEVEVYLRLDASPRSPGLTIVHDPATADDVRIFGPYLGGLRVRLAAAAVLRAFPLDYAGAFAGTARELGRLRGADPGDRRALAEQAALDWVTAPQRVARTDLTDALACGWADGMLVRFAVQGGRIRAWCQQQRSHADAAPLLAQTPPHWREFAEQNARLAARLCADATSASKTGAWMDDHYRSRDSNRPSTG
jgi:excinuclease ABC subunit C